MPIPPYKKSEPPGLWAATKKLPVAAEHAHRPTRAQVLNPKTPALTLAVLQTFHCRTVTADASSTRIGGTVLLNTGKARAELRFLSNPDWGGQRLFLVLGLDPDQKVALQTPRLLQQSALRMRNILKEGLPIQRFLEREYKLPLKKQCHDDGSFNHQALHEALRLRSRANDRARERQVDGWRMKYAQESGSVRTILGFCEAELSKGKPPPGKPLMP